MGQKDRIESQILETLNTQIDFVFDKILSDNTTRQTHDTNSRNYISSS